MHVTAQPYKTKCVSGRTLYLHRYVWEMAHGPIPAGMQVDHINGDKHDNRLDNLRLATNAQNNCNVPLRADSSSGYKNISWRARRKRWRVQVVYGDVLIDRQFKELQDAINFAARMRLSLHGDFACG